MNGPAPADQPNSAPRADRAVFAALRRRLPRVLHYGRFYRSELSPLLRRINVYLVRWMRKKDKRLRTFTNTHAASRRSTRQYPRYFAHRRWVRSSDSEIEKSPVTETVTPGSQGARR